LEKGEYEQAFQHCKSALKIYSRMYEFDVESESQIVSKGTEYVVSALMTIARVHHRQIEYDKALKHYLLALNIALRVYEISGDILNINSNVNRQTAEILQSIGSLHHDKANQEGVPQQQQVHYQRALEYYQRTRQAIHDLSLKGKKWASLEKSIEDVQNKLL